MTWANSVSFLNFHLYFKTSLSAFGRSVYVKFLVYNYSRIGKLWCIWQYNIVWKAISLYIVCSRTGSSCSIYVNILLIIICDHLMSIGTVFLSWNKSNWMCLKNCILTHHSNIFDIAAILYCIRGNQFYGIGNSDPFNTVVISYWIFSDLWNIEHTTVFTSSPYGIWYINIYVVSIVFCDFCSSVLKLHKTEITVFLCFTCCTNIETESRYRSYWCTHTGQHYKWKCKSQYFLSCFFKHTYLLLVSQKITFQILSGLCTDNPQAIVPLTATGMQLSAPVILF